MSQSHRDDFPLSVKKALADRAGNRCSFPGCGAPTSGPSDESNMAVSNAGMACHIVAASGGPGARRVDATMSKEMRRSIDNGIWMCSRDGRVIDTDEARFTVDMLKRWKALAERRARLSIEHGKPIELHPRDVADVAFADNVIVLHDLVGDNAVIGNAIRDSCIEVIWGYDVASCVRDAIIELTRNAFVHGRATEVTIGIQGRRITMTDDGQAFGLDALGTHPGGRGGAIALKHLSEKYTDRMVVTHRRDSSLNEVTFALAITVNDILEATPCALTVKPGDMSKRFTINVEASCKTIYFVLKQFLSVSDVFDLAVSLMEYRTSSRRFVFVVEDISPLVKEMFETHLPNDGLIIVSSYFGK